MISPSDEKLSHLKWCPECGCNANIIGWDSPIGKRWLCLYCGLSGRFGDGFSHPTEDQPDTLEYDD